MCPLCPTPTHCSLSGCFLPAQNTQLLLATCRTCTILNTAKEGTHDGHLSHTTPAQLHWPSGHQMVQVLSRPGPGYTLCTRKHSTTLYTATSDFFIFCPFSKSSPLKEFRYLLAFLTEHCTLSFMALNTICNYIFICEITI